jgi:hypothetical protein
VKNVFTTLQQIEKNKQIQTTYSFRSDFEYPYGYRCHSIYDLRERFILELSGL